MSFTKQLYVTAVRTIGVPAKAVGALRMMEKSSRSDVLWLRSLFSIYDSSDLAKLDLPWWTYGSIDFVKGWLENRQGNARAFEFGAGASTIWLAKRCAQVTSVEHDVEFANGMKDIFDEHSNVDVVVIPPAPIKDGCSKALSRREGYQDVAFDEYVNSINEHDGLYDLIVIDGRARCACLDAAKNRLSENGIVLFDNSNRKEYRQAIEASDLKEQAFEGRAPALPYGSMTSILTR